MKPSDFFIGVIDFFSVMLPGALLAYFLKGRVYAEVFGEGKLFPEPATEAAKWVVFLLVAYIAGNLIFMLASFIDFTYNRLLRRRLFQSRYDLTYKSARQIREKFMMTDRRLGELLEAHRISAKHYKKILRNPDREIFNTFKWSQHFLFFNKPEALADVQRTEADSKFFRSLVVTFLIIAVLLFVQGKNLLAVIFILLALLCYYRYGELRFKATEKAYEMIITFFHMKPEEAVVEIDSGTKPRSASALKTEVAADFSARHREQILFVTRRFSHPPKRLTIAPGESGTQHYISDHHDIWYCLQGHGSVQTVAGDQSAKTILSPTALVPIAKGSEFYLRNDGDQPIEILAFEN